jgi:S-adenosylmethionine:tRNA ribosyltransferase-isomerase
MNAVAPLRMREAHEPPEARGSGRDDVAMLVAGTHDGSLVHARFDDLPSFLEGGDLLVVNTSATLPAALPAELAGRAVELRLSTPAPDGTWLVELRDNDGSPLRPPPPGTEVELPAGAHATLLEPFAGGERLAVARLDLGAPLEEYLHRHGSPIRYSYVPAGWPLDAYQTVFALESGSAEMPSAARPFTTELVTELVARGILIAPITLHTGVSSPALGEPPFPERYRIPEATARVVNAARGWGGQVIAVGTTVVRALETTAAADGTIRAGEGWTNVVVSVETGIRAVDGLLTGWHEPDATHLQMLEALAGHELVERSYREASANGYRLHEFGDLHLILTRRLLEVQTAGARRLGQQMGSKRRKPFPINHAERPPGTGAKRHE